MLTELQDREAIGWECGHSFAPWAHISLAMCVLVATAYIFILAFGDSAAGQYRVWLEECKY